MNKNTQSPNTARAADEKAEMKSKAEKNLMDCKAREDFKRSSTEWTAVIVEQDNKTLKMKWIKTDELNESL